jgi:hypothetical protein
MGAARRRRRSALSLGRKCQNLPGTGDSAQIESPSTCAASAGASYGRVAAVTAPRLRTLARALRVERPARAARRLLLPAHCAPTSAITSSWWR